MYVTYVCWRTPSPRHSLWRLFLPPVPLAIQLTHPWPYGRRSRASPCTVRSRKFNSSVRPCPSVPFIYLPTTQPYYLYIVLCLFVVVPACCSLWVFCCELPTLPQGDNSPCIEKSLVTKPLSLSPGAQPLGSSVLICCLLDIASSCLSIRLLVGGMCCALGCM